MLRAENAAPCVCVMFYKEAKVQAVLIFCSEMWNILSSAMKCLEGFHICAAQRLSGKMPQKNCDGSWT